MVSGSNPADVFGWDGRDKNLTFTQDTPPSGQFVRQWKLRMRAQGAGFREVANSKLRRLLAHSKSFYFTDGAAGGPVLFPKTQNRKSFPRMRGPAKILDIGETGGTATFRSQTSEIFRYCARERLGEAAVHEDGRQNAAKTGGLWMSHTPACPDM